MERNLAVEENDLMEVAVLSERIKVLSNIVCNDYFSFNTRDSEVLKASLAYYYDNMSVVMNTIFAMSCEMMKIAYTLCDGSELILRKKEEIV